MVNGTTVLFTDAIRQNRKAREGAHVTVLGSSDTIFNELHTRAKEGHKWLDTGDHTVTIDPVGNKMWIRYDADSHFESDRRKRGLDADDVRDLQGWFAATDNVDWRPSVPSTATLDSMPQFTNSYSFRCGGHRGHPVADGNLPAITTLLRKNELWNKPKGQMEQEQRDTQRAIGYRVFDKTGWSPGVDMLDQLRFQAGY